MQLPPIEMKKFGGDVTDFAQFIRRFELKIASKLDNEQEKLHYLDQNMVPGSKPHAIVTSCIYLDGGYEQALNLLRRRYGQPSHIAAAFMDRISSFSMIEANDAEGLDRFALLLLRCKNALGTSAHMVGDPRTMRAVTSKLPEPMLNSWRRRADEIEERQGRSVQFEDVVKFIGDEARIASNPTYGRLMYSRDSNTAPPADNSASSGSIITPGPLVATTHAQQGNCAFCDSAGHSATECDQLRALPHDQRKAFAMRMSWCFSCFRRGHRSSACRRRASCRICERRHPTAMHLESQREDRQSSRHVNMQQLEAGQTREQMQSAIRPQSQQGNVTTGATACRTSGEVRTGRHALPLVPVVLCNSNKKVNTFAFLDSGSTHSFVTNSLLNQVGMQDAPSRQLTLTTVERGASIQTRLAAGLHITDMYGENEMELPMLYSMDKIPADPSDFPRHEDVRRWDHLREVELTEPEMTEVGLLLGANAFLAMEPRRVIPSVDGSPFAVLTRFGWVVSGLHSPSEGTSQTTVCRTAVNDGRAAIEEMVQKNVQQ